MVGTRRYPTNLACQEAFKWSSLNVNRRRLLCDSIRHSRRLDDHTTYIRVRLISRIGFYLTRQEAEGLDYDSDETISFEAGLPRSLEMVVDERERKKQRAMLDILQSVR